jgi:Ca2+-dependent lipid-binding protein
MSGTLVIKPIEAKLIRDVDLFTKMDPYCQVIIGNQVVKGKVCKSGGKNPHWDDAITIHKKHEPVCFVELIDKDTFTPDEIIGVCQLNLYELPSGNDTKKWYPLFYQQKPAGEILLEVIFISDQTTLPIIQPSQSATISDQSTGQPLNLFAPREQIIISSSSSVEQSHYSHESGHSSDQQGKPEDIYSHHYHHGGYVHPHMGIIDADHSHQHSKKKDA